MKSETGTAPIAVIKGAGPSGLAAAVALAQLGFCVTVAEKRAWRPWGAGRRNMVALRPDALRVLDSLGALRFLIKAGSLTDLVQGLTENEWLADGQPLRFMSWEPFIVRYPHQHGGPEDKPLDSASEYRIPERWWEQLPSVYVDLGDLEDALMKACGKYKNVTILHEATLELEPAREHSGRCRVTLVEDVNADTPIRSYMGHPDLIICASGKSDTSVARTFNFTRHTGIKLDPEHLPTRTSRLLNLNAAADHELESQYFSVFGVVNPRRRMGGMHHYTRRQNTGVPQQPVYEVEMSHKGSSHCVFMIPRGMDLGDTAALERYLVHRVNTKFDMRYESFEQMREQNVLEYGDPLQPVLVQTSTAPTYVFGSNVILIGDAAVCCSPVPGIGCDASISRDSQSVKELGQALIASREIEDQERRREVWDNALSVFNRKKATAGMVWSQASRQYYVDTQQSKNIIEQQRKPPRALL